MDQRRRLTRNRIIAAVLLVPAVVIAGFAIYLASLSGDLPWQEDPTRIPITPFANLPGSDTPTPVSTASPETAHVTYATPTPIDWSAYL